MTTAKTTKIANTFKAVSKIRDMDKETSKFIEELCKECIEYPKESKENEKEKFHDEKVNSYLIISLHFFSLGNR